MLMTRETIFKNQDANFLKVFRMFTHFDTDM